MELKPCPFCGRKLLYICGKHVNRYYNGEPTFYQHPSVDDCILGKYGKAIQVREKDIKAWNRRTDNGTD